MHSYTKRLRLRLPLTPMIDENAFYIELYRKSQTQTLGINRPLFLFIRMRAIGNQITSNKYHHLSAQIFNTFLDFPPHSDKNNFRGENDPKILPPPVKEWTTRSQGLMAHLINLIYQLCYHMGSAQRSHDFWEQIPSREGIGSGSGANPLSILSLWLA